MLKHKCLTDVYRFPGFSPQRHVVGIFGDPKARVIQLKRLEKKLDARNVVKPIAVFTIAKSVGFEIFHAATPGFIWKWKYAAWIVGDAEK
jgi:hypothetical protein